jgi:hypothetical protein
MLISIACPGNGESTPDQALSQCYRPIAARLVARPLYKSNHAAI